MRHLIRWAALSFIVAGMQAPSLHAAAAPKWTQLQTENFLFIGDASEGEIRRAAEKLEQFRDLLLRVLPGADVEAEVPTVVMVFDTDRSMSPVKPLFRGKPIETSGLFQGGQDVNYVVVNAESLETSMQSIFKMYAHSLIAESQGTVPVWVSTGLVEFYGTAEQQDGGKNVIIGRSPANHLVTLRSNTMMKIKELLDVEHDSRIYNEGNRRSVLFAQSWALVHYLLLGNEARAAQFRNYLVAMESGTPDEQAFATAFANDAALLDAELYEYVQRFAFPAVMVRFPEKSAAVSIPRGKMLDNDEADAYVADIQARIGRADDARARAGAIQKRNPQVGRALMVLGAIDLREKRLGDSLTTLEKAATLAPDDFIVQSTYGRSLVSQMSDVRNDAARAATLLAQARPSLVRATTLNPRSARAAYRLAYVEYAGGGDLAVAVGELKRAIELDPRHQNYQILLAQVLIRQGEYDKATALLGPLMGSGRTAAVRADARRVLGDMADRRVARAARSAATPPVTMPANTAASNAPAPTTSPTPPTATAGNRGDASRAVFVFRVVQPGEQRVLGTFDAVDCTRGSIVLHVTSNGRSLALKAAGFADVAFISYRPEAPKFPCGPQESRDRVYATYRPDTSSAGIDGIAVAVELLPDDFVPPNPPH